MKPALAAVQSVQPEEHKSVTPKESEPEVSLQNDIDTSAKHVDGQSVGALDGKRPAVGKALDQGAKHVAKRRRPKWLRLYQRAKVIQNPVRRSPVKSRRSSNYDRLSDCASSRKSKAGAQKNVERVTEGGDWHVNCRRRKSNF